jgi:cyclopropane-fatty-acyl-phospholipid synthase
VSDIGIALAERGWLPDAAIRLGIRRLLARHLATLPQVTGSSREWNDRLAESLRAGPVAVHTGEANLQHYEVPAEFYRLWLGPRMKYSACWWPEGVDDLAAAEEAMLALTGERALLADGQRILDLGCGWGSFSLWAAAHYPNARLLAISNSASQRAFIEAEAGRQGLSNLEARTADVGTLDLRERFDRIVSIEMLEHVRNHEALFRRLAGWLEPGGRLFVHVFAHRETAYLFETEGEETWMARHFFTGGMMPSRDWLPRARGDLALEEDWWLDGSHYARTLEAWLVRLDRARDEAIRLLAGEGGGTPAAARRSLQRWRIFLMACAELFAYRDGTEWGVCHHRFRKS